MTDVVSLENAVGRVALPNWKFSFNELTWN